MKLIYLILLIPLLLYSQTLIGSFSFENNLNDPLGNLTTYEWYDGVATNIVSYVPGYSGYAARTSHNSDDGGNDFGIILPSSWTATRERYIRFYVKYESNYWGDCDGIWNVKWVWTAGSEAHNELIFQYYSGGNIGLTWQLIGGVSHWSNGSNLRYGTPFPYTFGNWMLVEIYFHLSSGANYDQADGIQWVKVNGNYIINDSGVTTGLPGQMYSPALKASCDCPSGQGWWQIDEYVLYDGIPGDNPDDTTPPTASGDLYRPSDYQLRIQVYNISSDLYSGAIRFPDSSTTFKSITDNTAIDTTWTIGTGFNEWKYLYFWAIDDSGNVTHPSILLDSLYFIEPNPPSVLKTKLLNVRVRKE